MSSMFHFQPQSPVAVGNPVLTGPVNVQGGPLNIDGVAVIGRDLSGNFSTLNLGAEPVAPGPLLPGPFANDAAATAAGVAVGQCYVQTLTGFLRTRMS